MNAATARLIAYLAAVALGIFMTVWGVIHSAPATVTAGIGLVTTGTLAGANVSRGDGESDKAI